MSRKYFPKNVYGISEELLIILLLKYNKFDIKSWIFKSENIIEVQEINKLKNHYLVDKFAGVKIKDDNYMICQRKYNGENYDLLIIQSTISSKYAIFVQIGVDKTKADIQKQYQDLSLNSKKYLNCLIDFFGFNIEYITLLYIFDEDTQNGLRSPNEKSGSQLCINFGIDHLLYSFNDNALKKYNKDTKEYRSINGKNYYVEKMISK